MGDECPGLGHRSRRAPTNASIGSTAPRRLNASAPSNGRVERSDEGRGHVADVLKVLLAAITDPIRLSQCNRLDRLGWLAGHAEIAADAVHGPRTKADAGDAVIQPVYSSVELVTDFERTVVTEERQADLVADRTAAPSAGGPWTAAELAYTTRRT